MSDLIRRQDAIDAMLECCSSVCDNEYECGYDDGLRKGMHKLKHLPPAQAEPKWIPCSERLPDSRRSVLITVSNGKDYETSEAYYHELRKDWFEVNGDRVCEMSPSWKTIAWCELPEPWKGEE